MITWTSTHEFANKYDKLEEQKELTVKMEGVSIKDAKGKQLLHYLKDGKIEIPNQIGVTETDESGKVIEGTANSNAKIPDGWFDISEATELNFESDPEVDKKAVQEDVSTDESADTSTSKTDDSTSDSASTKDSTSTKATKDEEVTDSTSSSTSTSSK